MNLADLVNRQPAELWAPGSKIPWHEADFSRRMLREHLSQDHDRASRRFEIVDRQVGWLHGSVLAGRAGCVLDLGCGPGFYANRLARLGHRCLGFDFSPASVEHARSEAEREDLRRAELGTGFDAALLVFGELNTFPPEEAREILTRARQALAPGGAMVLEVHEEDFVNASGQAAPFWYTARQSVFSDDPHLCLRECSWHPRARVAIERWFVLHQDGSAVDTYTSTLQGYSRAAYADLLEAAGFTESEEVESLEGPGGEPAQGLFVLVAR